MHYLLRTYGVMYICMYVHTYTNTNRRLCMQLSFGTALTLHILHTYMPSKVPASKKEIQSPNLIHRIPTCTHIHVCPRNFALVFAPKMHAFHEISYSGMSLRPNTAWVELCTDLLLPVSANGALAQSAEPVPCIGGDEGPLMFLHAVHLSRCPWFGFHVRRRLSSRWRGLVFLLARSLLSFPTRFSNSRRPRCICPPFVMSLCMQSLVPPAPIGQTPPRTQLAYAATPLIRTSTCLFAPSSTRLKGPPESAAFGEAAVGNYCSTPAGPCRRGTCS